METARICNCEQPDLHNVDECLCCLSCGQIGFDTEPHGPHSVVTGKNQHAPFEYRPLRSDASLRLVRLYAGRREDDITCHIFHSTLSDHPPFEALSYTWGEATLSHEIFSTKGILKVTKNCAAALRDLRYSFRDRTLWIDILCINQGNDDEKSKQVPLMSEIYAAARRVVIYIGSDTRADLGRFFSYFRCSEASNCAADSVAQAAVSSFLSRPWFSRVWILQEVAVARDAILMWGTATLDWKYFSAAHLNNLQLMPVDCTGKVPPVLLFTEDDPKPLKDLVSLIHTARSCRSTEPRDKIYALLGLLDQVQHTLKPDYKKSIETLHVELVMNIVKSYNHLDILALAGTETEEEALCARKLALKVGGMAKSASFAGERIEDAAKKVADAEKRAEVGVANLLVAEKAGRQAWARLRNLEEAWRQVQEAEDVWKELHERYEALREVQVKLVEWGASMDIQKTKSFWRKRKAEAQSLQMQEMKEIAWKDSLTKENMVWQKWSGLRKVRWELAKEKAERSRIEIKSAEERELHELTILEREWNELQEEERLNGMSMGIDVALRKYKRKYKTWHELQAKADEERSQIEQEDRRRQDFIKNETVERDALSGAMLAPAGAMSQQNKASGSKADLETAFRDCQSKIQELARDLHEARERARRRLDKERNAWSKTAPLESHDDPQESLLKAEDAWQAAKRAVDKASHDPLVAQFNEESRRYEMLRCERSSFYPEIQRIISQDLHSKARFPAGQRDKNTSPRLPSWVPGLDDRQYLTSLAYFQHRKSEYPRTVARQCIQNHSHESPGLEIKMLELDTIKTDCIPDAGSMGQGDTGPAGFGRAFLHTNSLPDKPWGSEREDFLSRYQQSYRSETRGSTFAQIRIFCQGRRRMLTEKTWIVCSGQVKMSDKVCAIYGASVPFVLRPTLDGQTYKLLGECYLEGFLGPKFADDYLDLLGRFRQYFAATTSEELPWKTVCLE